MNEKISMLLNIEALLAPISDDNPCGEDLTFQPLFDDIKEARRQDDPSLDQGEWKTEIKAADWNKVKDLATDAFQNKTKDLQIGAWLTESVLQLQGFSGLSEGINLITELLENQWDNLYPLVEDGDLDLRASRLNWMETNLPIQIREIPLTTSGAYGWLKWQESKDVDNLSRKNEEAASAALSDGKINGEKWNNAVLATDADFYHTLMQDISTSVLAIDSLTSMVDDKFGANSPSLMELKGAIVDCQKLVISCAAQKGLISDDGGDNGAPNEAQQSSDNSLSSAATINKSAIVGVSTKAEALNALALVAEFFRKSEPHSPVSYIVQRAISWGGMDLNDWLNEMIKDETTLSQLRETLGITENSDSDDD